MCVSSNSTWVRYLDFQGFNTTHQKAGSRRPNSAAGEAVCVCVCKSVEELVRRDGDVCEQER